MKKLKNKKTREIHKHPTKVWRKQVLQNKPVSFRPTDKQIAALKQLKLTDKSKFIKEALDMRMELFDDPEKFFIKWGRKMHQPFERANRKIKRELKEERLIYKNKNGK